MESLQAAYGPWSETNVPVGRWSQTMAPNNSEALRRWDVVLLFPPPSVTRPGDRARSRVRWQSVRDGAVANESGVLSGRPEFIGQVERVDIADSRAGTDRLP